MTAAAALLVCLLAIVWLVRTWKHGDFLRIEHQTGQQVKDQAYVLNNGVEVGSRNEKGENEKGDITQYTPM